jgi:hypothetical protein
MPISKEDALKIKSMFESIINAKPTYASNHNYELFNIEKEVCKVLNIEYKELNTHININTKKMSMGDMNAM